MFPESFLIYQAREQASGDFYWAEQLDGKRFIVVADCTGHGVKGALMTGLSYALLTAIVVRQQIHECHDILQAFDQAFTLALHPTQTDDAEGVEMAICRMEGKENGMIQVQFAGAKRSVYYCQEKNEHRGHQEGQLMELSGDKHRIGGFRKQTEKRFTSQMLDLPVGSQLYFYTDGLENIPSPQRRNFGKPRIKDLITHNCHQPMEEQREAFARAIQSHSEGILLRDDLTLLGLKLPTMPYIDKIVRTTTNGVVAEEVSGGNIPKFNFFEYHAAINFEQVVLSYKGPLTDILLAELSKDVREKISENPKAGKKVFSIFMELAQNVLFYSKEVNHFGNNDKVGTLVILDNGPAYQILTGNIVLKDSVQFIREKCEKVNTLDRDGLREYKRFLRNTPEQGSEESRGAGIGIVQATLLSDNPLGYTIREFESGNAFFLLNITVDKQGKK
ncbi:MAG: hypothetical protein OHK0053_31920 [Microscillaceae bacterium]